MKKKGRPLAIPRPVLLRGFLLLFCLSLAFNAYAQSPSQAAKPPPSPEAMRSSFQSALQLFQRGRQLQIAGKESDAAKAFASSLQGALKLVAIEPLNQDYISLQCWNLFRLGRHNEVLTVAQKALKSAQDHRVIETLAESLYFLDRSEEALEYFALYFSLAPENDERRSSAYYYVGECYVRLKKYEHADIAFSTATTLEKNMYYWWYRLGAVKEILLQYRRAYEAYGKSLQLSPKFQFALDGRARVKAKAGL